MNLVKQKIILHRDEMNLMKVLEWGRRSLENGLETTPRNQRS